MSFQGSQSVYEGSGVATVCASLMSTYTTPREIPLQINTIDGTAIGKSIALQLKTSASIVCNCVSENK